MSWFTDLWSSQDKGARGAQYSEVTWQDLQAHYEIVEVVDEPGAQFAIVEDARNVDTSEIGTTSASPFTSFVRQEYNIALQGLRGLEMYDKMRKSDGAVRGTLRGVKSPVLSARWFVAKNKRGDKDIDQQAADWVWCNLTELMSIGWTQVLTESLLMLDFGYYMFEKVWGEPEMIDGKLRMRLRKLAPRHPMDVKRWEFDNNGGPLGVWMYDLRGQNNPGPQPDAVFIPIDKLLVFSFDREGGNLEGISVLRSAYKHWYFKEQLYKIDAIQKERHGIGIPVIKLPPGYTNEDKIAAQNLGRNIRTNERAHIVLPPGWDVMMLKLEGQPIDIVKSVDHHNAMIRENILLSFLKEGAKEDDSTMFQKATRFVADNICDTINLYLIPQMVQYNFAFAKNPQLKARRIGESAEQRTLSFALRNMIGAGVIYPDDRLEDWMRDQLDAPERDPDTARHPAAPQAGPNAGQGTPAQNTPNPPSAPKPGRTGPPRQAPVGKQRNTQGLPRSNAGTDHSGGK
jgi:hypothetical protein